MTNENRIFIEAEDLLGVEFECGQCQARLFYKLPGQPMRIASRCPNCNEPFYGPTEMENFQQFFALLTAMPRLSSNNKLRVRIQVASGDK